MNEKCEIFFLIAFSIFKCLTIEVKRKEMWVEMFQDNKNRSNTQLKRKSITPLAFPFSHHLSSFSIVRCNFFYSFFFHEVKIIFLFRKQPVSTESCKSWEKGKSHFVKQFTSKAICRRSGKLLREQFSN